MNIWNKIYEDVINRVRFEPYDKTTRETHEYISSYIKDKYSGNYKIIVAEDSVFRIIFDTPEDATIFILKYS